jgi:hypothetical protein
MCGVSRGYNMAAAAAAAVYVHKPPLRALTTTSGAGCPQVDNYAAQAHKGINMYKVLHVMS